MNLRDLQYLVTTADLLNFSKAAEKCSVSQPTLSEQIRKTEESLEIKIFERSNRKVFLTEEGKEVINSARNILNELENIKQTAKNFKNPLGGNFSLGAFPTLAPYIFPTIVPKIKTNLPKLKLILVEEKTAVLINKLKKGELDAALLALPIEENQLETHTLFKDKFFLAVPPKHELAEKKKLSVSGLDSHDLLLLEEGHCLRDQALEVCAKSGIEEEQNFRATSLETLRQMIKAGTGITFMPEIAIGKNETGIKYIPLEPTPSRTIALVWRKTANKEQILKILCKIISDR